MSFEKNNWFEHHPDPMWVYDLETLKFLEVNNAAIQKYAFSRAEFFEKTIKDIRPPEDVDILLDNVSAVTHGLDEAGIWRHVLRNGTIIHVDIRSHATTYAGRPAEIVCARDVSHLIGLEKQLDDALQREREARAEAESAASLLRVAGHVAQFGGWWYRLGDEYVTWSEETARIHELPTARIIPLETALSFYTAESRPIIERKFTECLERGIPFKETLPLATASGALIWVHAIGEPEFDKDGAIVGAYGAFQDVSTLMQLRLEADSLRQRVVQTLEEIRDAVIFLDREWNITFANREAHKLVKRPFGELTGRHLWTEFPEAIGTRFQAQYEHALEEQTPVSFIEYFGPLGSWIEVDAHPAPNGLVLYFRDITEDRAKRERLQVLETAIAHINDIVLITSAEPLDAPDGPRIEFVNSAFEKITGFRAQDVLGKTPRLLQGPETQRAELDRIRAGLERREAVSAELINYTKTGEPIWLEIEIVPLFDQSGWCTHFVALERDVTERKAVQEALALSEERFRLVAQATNDVIWDWRLESDLGWWNEAVERVFGYAPSMLEPSPESWTSRIHPEDRARVQDGIQAVIDGNETRWRDEYRFLRADGSEAIVIDRGFVIRNEMGRAVRMVGSMVDVTERRQLNEQLQQSQKLEAVGHLTGGIAHDFNNLLTILVGNSEMLASALLEDENLRSMAEMSLSAAERGAELTSRLLAFSRKQALEPKNIDVNKLLSDILELLKRTIPEKVEFKFIPDKCLKLAFIDAGQLETAVLNLVINARDAMPDGGWLTIETANTFLDTEYTRLNAEVTSGHYVLLSISDTGTGMPAEVVEKAFDPFFTTKEAGKGSGLGLSMVFGFLKQSGGHIKIYSEEGYGTTVKLYIPIATSREVHSTNIAPRDQPLIGNEHILLVEDDDLVRQHVASLLKSFGYHVTEANSGPKALQILKEKSDISLLFTDVVMPGGMSARDLSNSAQSLYPEIKTLFTSGYTENAIAYRNLLDSDAKFLRKPYRSAILAKLIREILDK